ncbi:hypothetical protein [Delftia tsuruhatensis]|uniref:hypothetical protein n=1 Tax=Delftia tsuruhatensis TaxID=180282 RepID=UPI002260F8E6|nr:hypothetical protein [Delftia tsuruhatensis]MCX7509423.1 hypothetical protein [Delftia tsuruhatensis]
MYTISIIAKSGDRVITATRVNSGQETLAGLDDGQSLEVMMGRAVVLPRPGHSEAIVELHMRSGSWEFKGAADTLPSLDELADDDARKAALDGWAQSSILLASYGG